MAIGDRIAARPAQGRDPGVRRESRCDGLLALRA
jgi:hypothetical protein